MGVKCYRSSKETFLRANGKPNQNPTEDLDILYRRGPNLSDISQHFHTFSWNKQRQTASAKQPSYTSLPLGSAVISMAQFSLSSLRRF